jgi:NADPH:quinone reductase-like Zn-dependent oxidoreductase
MKAICFHEHGDIDVLKYESIADPICGNNHALIKVKAVALNHLDIWVRRGWKGLNLDLPHVTGSDIVGEIVSIPSSVTNFKVGQRVLIYPGVNTINDEWTRRGEVSLSLGYKIIGEHLKGGLAELVSVPIECLVSTPDNLSDEQLAGVPLVSLTTWRMLFKQAKLIAGESVLVVGSGGGVNIMSVIMAKLSGANVIVLSGSSKKAGQIKKLGIDQIIRYDKNQDWHKEVLKLTRGRGVDLVIDNVGASTFNKSLKALRRGGRLVTVGNTTGAEFLIDNRMIFTKQISIIGSTMGSIQDLLDALEFIFLHKIEPIIDSVSPLSDGIKLIKKLEAGEQFGKIILKP